jgi:outer membrane lipoprotein
MRTFGHLKFIILVLSISGCAYPISQQLREEAAKNVTFPMVLNNPPAYIGDIVIWGGTIIRTVNLKAGTEIFILDTPLNQRGVPKQAIHSRGRFVAKSSKFFDPAVYKRGNQVTVAGEISGEKTLPLGQTRYTYPVIRIKEIHLWENEHYYPDYFDDYGYYHYWRGPYYPPGFWGFYGDDRENEEHEGRTGAEEGEEHEGGHHGN